MINELNQEIEQLEIEIPTPGPGEVLLRVDVAGLCHSDLHIIDWHNCSLPSGALARQGNCFLNGGTQSFANHCSTICFEEFFQRHGPAPAAVRVKDVWARTTSTHACCGWGNYSRELAPHDTVFLLLDPRPLQGKSQP